jgi:hypothetical protein
VEFKVVYSRLLSVTRLSRPMTMATTTAMMPANIGVLSGAASGAAGSGGAAVTHRAVCADDVQ